MRIFLLTSEIPGKPAGGRARAVMVNEALAALSELGHEVFLQLILPEAQRDLTDEEVANLARVRAEQTAAVQPILWRGDIPEPTGTDWKRWLEFNLRLEDCYPFHELGPVLNERVKEAAPAFLLSMFGPAALGASGAVHSRPKALLYGSPDFNLLQAELDDPVLLGRRPWSGLGRFHQRLKIQAGKKWLAHLMRRQDLVWVTSGLDAKLLQDLGVPVRHAGNMWPISMPLDTAERRGEKEILHPLKICAGLGGLEGAEKGHALQFLGEDIAPALLEMMGRGSVELHVFGGGAPSRPVVNALRHPLIRLRGLVQNLEDELLQCPIFLSCENSGRYKTSPAWIYQAWSLHGCVIAHANSQQALPELEHGKNVLLARDADDYPRWIELAKLDRDLRGRLGREGRRTMERTANGRRWMEKLVESMTELS